MKTMCPPGYHHNGFVATHALGHMMYGSTLLVPMNQRVLNKQSKERNYIYIYSVYIYIYIYIYVAGLLVSSGCYRLTLWIPCTTNIVKVGMNESAVSHFRSDIYEKRLFVFKNFFILKLAFLNALRFLALG